MAAQAKQTCYEGSAVQSFQFYLKHLGGAQGHSSVCSQYPAKKIQKV